MHNLSTLPIKTKLLLAAAAALLLSCGLCLLVSRLPEPPRQEASLETAVAHALAATQQMAPSITPSVEAIVIEATPTAAFALACLNNKPAQQAVVVDITDGDTIRVELEGHIQRVRYIGMDAPDGLGSGLATQANAALVLGQPVLLIADVSQVDDFERLLRYVVVDGVLVNAELVRQGLAVAASYPPDTACDAALLAAQHSAQAAQLGVWQATPTASHLSATLRIVSVNKREEYVDIQNVGGASQELQGWVLLSERGNQRCNLAGTVQPGETLRIWAANGPSGYSCGYNAPIWNNAQVDPAVLYDAAGNVVSRYP